MPAISLEVGAELGARSTAVSPLKLDREFELLISRGLSNADLRREVAARVTRLIPADGWCVSSVDPNNLLITDTCHTGIEPEFGAAFYQNEYGESDYGKHVELVSEPGRGAVLSVLTGGRLERSNRYRTVLAPMGYEHELRLAAVSGDTPWGLVHLYRKPGRRDFTADELRTLVRSQATLARALRASAVAALPGRIGVVRAAGHEASAPATILIAFDGRIVGRAGAAQSCLDAFTDPEHPKLPIPVVLQSIVFAVRCGPGRSESMPVRMRALGRLGEWWTLSAAIMLDATHRDVIAITAQRVAGSQLADIAMRALGLTPAERRVCDLVLAGASTKLISRTLYISAYTVQDRLKSIFVKAQVGSRAELMALLS